MHTCLRFFKDWGEKVIVKICRYDKNMAHESSHIICRNFIVKINRSNTPEGFLTCSRFTGEHQYQSVILIKLLWQLYWNRTSTWVFCYKFAAYFQNTFSKECFWRAASGKTFLLFSLDYQTYYIHKYPRGAYGAIYLA